MHPHAPTATATNTTFTQEVTVEEMLVGLATAETALILMLVKGRQKHVVK